MGSTPKRKVVGSTPIWDAIFKRFNRIFNGFWRVNDKRDLSDVFIIQISFWYAGHGIYLDSESLLWGL